MNTERGVDTTDFSQEEQIRFEINILNFAVNALEKTPGLVQDVLKKQKEALLSKIESRQRMLETLQAEKFLNAPCKPNDGKWIIKNYTLASLFGGIENAKQIFPHRTEAECLELQRAYEFNYHDITLTIENNSSSMCWIGDIPLEDREYVSQIRNDFYIKGLVDKFINPRSQN